MSFGVNNNVGSYYPAPGCSQNKIHSQAGNCDLPHASSAENIPNTNPPAENTRENMSMAEYKQYIHNLISRLPINPTLSGWNHNVVISEEGFEAMKNDPEYEAWVLDAIGSNFAVTIPFRTSTNAYQFFGATKGEAHGYVEGSSPKASRTDEEDSFWQKRAERYRDQRERNQELRMELARFQTRLLQGLQLQNIYSDAGRAVACYDANIFPGL